MKKETILDVDIEDLKASEIAMDYAGEDCIIIHALDHLPNSNGMIRLNCFLILYCMEGCIQLEINGKNYLLEANDLAYAIPSSVICHMMISPAHKIKIIGFSSGLMRQVLKLEKDIWNTFSYAKNNPVRHVHFEGKRDHLRQLYWNLILEKIGEKSHRYHKEILRYLFSAMLCEIMADLSGKSSETSIGQSSDIVPKQADYIFKRFMEKLAADKGMHRSVAYYADALSYTPKYLSKVIKSVSGKKALTIINKHAIECIKLQLRHSDKSIKEIAEEFNFSNISFFGKFVKAHLGVSPMNYRASLHQEE